MSEVPRGLVIVVMGVTSVGKTTIGKLLAERLGARFAEGDSYHSAANVEKMRSGVPLEDADRWPWLEAIRADAATWLASGTPAVITCSALKRRYREILRGAGAGLRFVHLTANRVLIADRMAGRQGHYMPPSLLPSQLATLEPPGPDEDVIEVDVAGEPAAIVDAILAQLSRRPAPA
jgi:gluconokinase